MLTRSAYNQQRLACQTNQIITETMCRLQEICAICLSSVSGSDVYHTPCRHVFHKECYERQLGSMRENRELCAICRNDLEECIDEHPTLSLIPIQQPSEEDEEELDELTVYVINSFNDAQTIITVEQYESDTESFHEDQLWLNNYDEYGNYVEYADNEYNINEVDSIS